MFLFVVREAGTEKRATSVVIVTGICWDPQPSLVTRLRMEAWLGIQRFQFAKKRRKVLFCLTRFYFTLKYLLYISIHFFKRSRSS